MCSENILCQIYLSFVNLLKEGNLLQLHKQSMILSWCFKILLLVVEFVLKLINSCPVSIFHFEFLDYEDYMSLKKLNAIYLTLAGLLSDSVWKTVMDIKALVSAFLELYVN